MDFTTLWPVIRDGGVLALMFLILVSGARGFWVWEWQYKDLLKDRDEWKARALKNMELAETATRVAQEAVARPVRRER